MEKSLSDILYVFLEVKWLKLETVYQFNFLDIFNLFWLFVYTRHKLYRAIKLALCKYVMQDQTALSTMDF